MNWIDINKLTPEFDQLVLVASDDDVFCAYWRHAENFGGYFESNLNISHWMPLPEPPKEKEEG